MLSNTLLAELFLSESYSHSSSTLSSKNNIGHIPKNKQKNKFFCIHAINLNENEDENEK